MRRELADQNGSMLPLFVVFVMLLLLLAGSATNLAAIALQTQRLQQEADQTALSNYTALGLEIGQTTLHENCSEFELPLKLIALPATHQICVRSAAR